MHHAVNDLTRKATWKITTLLKVKKYYSRPALINLYTAHVISYIESRTPGIYHATDTTLNPLDDLQKWFLHELGLDENEALEIFLNLAPLATRRDIAMLDF